MNLLRIIPARIETVELDWCKPDFAIMCDSYRKERERVGGGLMSCCWCEKNFNEGDQIALAGKHGKRNIVLCAECSDKLTHSGE